MQIIPWESRRKERPKEEKRVVEQFWLTTEKESRLDLRVGVTRTNRL